jgi:hypothetical protein
LGEKVDLIWLHDGGELIRVVRLAYELTHQEFADRLGRKLGWDVPVTVLAHHGEIDQAFRRKADTRFGEGGRGSERGDATTLCTCPWT